MLKAILVNNEVLCVDLFNKDYKNYKMCSKLDILNRACAIGDLPENQMIMTSDMVVQFDDNGMIDILNL